MLARSYKHGSQDHPLTHIKIESIGPGLAQQGNHPSPSKKSPQRTAPIDGEQAKLRAAKYLELPETRHTAEAVVKAADVVDTETSRRKTTKNKRKLVIYQLSAARVGQWTT
jgi:hypothetical protein